MRRRSTQKQIHYLRNVSSFSRSSAPDIIRKNLPPMRASGLLFVGLAATAGISTLAFALQHDSSPNHRTFTPASQTTTPSSSSAQIDDSSVKVETSQTSTGPNPTDNTPAVTGQATINDETIPLTEGTVERSYTDANGNEHTVIISIDNGSTSVESNSSSTNIQLHSSSSSTSDTNKTRGSPRR